MTFSASRLSIFALAAASLFLTGCFEATYKTPASVSDVNERASAARTHVSVAKTSSKDAQARSAAAESKTKAGQTSAKTVADNIDAAIASLEARNYTTAAQHLVAAKVGNTVVMTFLQDTLSDLVSMRANFDTVATELNGAENEIAALKKDAAALQKKIDEQTLETAPDHEIAVRCKSWFGLGAIFFGIERMLKAGIIGILIFAGIAIAIVIVGYLVGGPFGAAVMGLGRKVIRR